MKKYLYILGIAASLLNFTSCSEDDLDPKSIFEAIKQIFGRHPVLTV